MRAGDRRVPKVAVLGANGQVGAELCLLLARVPGLELVPVCRNRSGSAFLRWQGVACRHGRPAEPLQAAALFSDCDAVVNCALATGSPRAMRRMEDRIVQSMVEHSRPGTVLVHFSTQSVYGDAQPGRLIRWRSLYGRAKLATERHLTRVARGAGRAVFIFRLGHVCGPLQDITHSIREEILDGPPALPQGDGPSNTVFTVTIRDAVLSAIADKLRPGTYDLMNVPQWTWTEVYAYEAEVAGRALNLRRVPAGATHAGIAPALAGVLRRLVAGAASNSFLRQLAGSLIAYAPDSLSRRSHAWWHRIRARRQIAELSGGRALAEHLSWIANGSRFPPDLAPTRVALESNPYEGIGDAPSGHGVWPEDLPLAAVAHSGTAAEPA